MQSFDQHLLKHLQAGRVTFEEGMKVASSPHDFKLLVQADQRLRHLASSNGTAATREGQPTSELPAAPSPVAEPAPSVVADVAPPPLAPPPAEAMYAAPPPPAPEPAPVAPPGSAPPPGF
jgi:twitching motility protein PilT